MGYSGGVGFQIFSNHVDNRYQKSLIVTALQGLQNKLAQKDIRCISEQKIRHS